MKYFCGTKHKDIKLINFHYAKCTMLTWEML